MECNAIQQTESQENKECQPEVDERGYVFGKQKQVFRHIDFGKNAGIVNQRGHTLVGGVAEVGENECPGKQVCGIVVCCPAKKFGEYDSHDEQG